MQKDTISKIIWFCVMVITLLIMFTAVYLEASEIDYESLRRLAPRGECIGGEIPEMQVSVFYCKPYWQDITINIWRGL